MPLIGAAPAGLVQTWARVQKELRAELGAADAHAMTDRLRLIGEMDGAWVFLAPNVTCRLRAERQAAERIARRMGSPDGVRKPVVIRTIDQFSTDDRALIEDILGASLSENGAPDGGGPPGSKKTGPEGRAEAPKTFANLRIGDSNRMAAHQARAIAFGESDVGVTYLYGPQGVGKTHMLEAIQHEIGRKQPGRKVLMMTAERFVTAFQSALKSRGTDTFKESVRSADLLLIDDLQFICGVVSQEEFFHTVDTLVSNGRQVVMTGDRPADDLPKLHERVRARVKGGISVPIDLPNFDLRRAILELKVQAKRQRHPEFDPPSHVLDMVATRVVGTGRDMEGAVNQLAIYSQALSAPMTVETAEDALRDKLASASRAPTIDVIQKIVARQYGLTHAELLAKNRRLNVVRPRQLAMYLSRQLTRRSLPDIGHRFGGRDHTTVMSAIRKIEKLMKADKAMMADVDQLMRRIRDGNEPGNSN